MLLSLFHQDVIVSVLASGSSGNCTLVSDGTFGVLIDCGVSTRQILRRMEDVGLGHVRIEAVLITHEHSDHVGAARVLDKRLSRGRAERVPFYMTPGTAEGARPTVLPMRREPVRSGAPITVCAQSILGPWTVEPFVVPHDTLDPVAYCVQVGETRVGVITDLGRPTRLVAQKLHSLDVAVVEFNHDVEMLMDGPYPWRVKQRVRGQHGHLSNHQAEALVAEAASSRLSHLVLAHLSQDNNRPEKALVAAQRALHRAGRRQVTVHVAKQREPLRPVRIPTSRL